MRELVERWKKNKLMERQDEQQKDCKNDEEDMAMYEHEKIVQKVDYREANLNLMLET